MVLLLAACAGATEEGPIAEAPEEPGPVIAIFELRDRKLTISSSSGASDQRGSGVRYEVTDAVGQTYSQLTLEELEAVAPELAKLVRSGTASHSLDARLESTAPGATLWGGR